MPLRPHRIGPSALLAGAAVVLSACSVLAPAQTPTSSTPGATAAAGTSGEAGADPSSTETAITAGESDSAATGENTAESTGESDAEKDADAAGNVLYLQRMVQFTRQQQALADLALHRSTNPEVIALARSMKTSRATTVDRLDAALAKLGSGAPEPASTEGLGWAGMLTSAQTKMLAGMSKAGFDRYWTTAVAMTDDEALTISRSQASSSDDAADKDGATALITALTSEYQTASHLAGPADKRPVIPAG